MVWFSNKTSKQIGMPNETLLGKKFKILQKSVLCFYCLFRSLYMQCFQCLSVYVFGSSKTLVEVVHPKNYSLSKSNAPNAKEQPFESTVSDTGVSKLLE